MTPEDVMEVLDQLEAAGIDCWVDGGWGIDALAGEETRHHSDLDLAVARSDVEAILAALAALGFSEDIEAEPGRPARVVVHDARGRSVDIHPLAFDDRGDGWQDLGGGRRGLYSAEGLLGEGRIGGRAVRCLTPDLQKRHRSGYEPSERDRHDLGVLRNHTGA